MIWVCATSPSSEIAGMPISWAAAGLMTGGVPCAPGAASPSIVANSAASSSIAARSSSVSPPSRS